MKLPTSIDCIATEPTLRVVYRRTASAATEVCSERTRFSAAKLRVAENRVRSLHTSVAALAVRLYTTRSVGSVAMQSIEVGNFMDYTRSQQYTAASTTKDL